MSPLRLGTEDRSDGTTPAYWGAWHADPNQQQPIVFDKITNAWYQWDNINNCYFENEDGIKRQWFPSNQWSYDI